MLKNKTEHKLWLYVIGTMVIIATLWAALFYPQSLKKSSLAADGGFSGFKNKIENALAIFKAAPAAAPDKTSADDVDALREKVFGDSTKRSQ